MMQDVQRKPFNHKKILVHAFFIIQILFFVFKYLQTSSFSYAILATIFSFLYFFLLLFKLLINTFGNKDLTLEQALQRVNKLKDISTRTKKRGVIINFYEQQKVLDKGKVIGQIFYFHIKTEGGGTLRISHIIPISHIGSFTINTPVTVLMNDNGVYGTFAPDEENWHFEVKK